MSAILTPIYATSALADTTTMPVDAGGSAASPADHTCECKQAWSAVSRQRTANMVLLLYGLFYLLVVIALLKYILF